jgi:hypothetical protein
MPSGPPVALIVGMVEWLAERVGVRLRVVIVATIMGS